MPRTFWTAALTAILSLAVLSNPASAFFFKTAAAPQPTCQNGTCQTSTYPISTCQNGSCQTGVSSAPAQTYPVAAPVYTQPVTYAAPVYTPATTHAAPTVASTYSAPVACASCQGVTSAPVYTPVSTCAAPVYTPVSTCVAHPVVSACYASTVPGNCYAPVQPTCGTVQSYSVPVRSCGCSGR